MSQDRLQAQQALQSGMAQGLLPPDASLPEPDSRPWPVNLLTALGAWLAAIPLIGVVSMLLGDLLTRGVGPYFVGSLLLALVIVVLRSQNLPVFVEQLAVPALLVGGGAFSIGLSRDLPWQGAAAILALLALGLAVAIPRPWLRVLLGAQSAAMAITALLPSHLFTSGNGAVFALWLTLHAALLLACLAPIAQRRPGAMGARAQLPAAIESVSTGWLLLTLAGLCWWSGLSFLFGASLGGGPLSQLAGDAMGGRGPSALADTRLLLAQAGSTGLALLATALAAHNWPRLRQPLVGAVAAILVGLCWFLPALGAVLLVLAWTLTTGRWRLSGAAAFAVVWIVGGFYYQLHWSLVNKALVLLVASTGLGALAWAAHRALHAGASKPTATAPAAPHRHSLALWVGLSAVTTVVLVNLSIWQKERLIERGEKLFVELAPVDPRSLMQGDFMRLNYRMPSGAGPEGGQKLSAKRPHVIARRDARGVAQLLRVEPANAALAAGEMRIELTPRNGGWTLVSDAWFFREGDAKRWEAAKYGEFRVARNGQALLVGLADVQLRPMGPAP